MNLEAEMQMNSFKKNRNLPRHLIIPTLLLLLVFIAPPSVFAEDENSIATLRQMGKTFASIAEDASPAVISLRAEKTVTQESSQFRDSPFGGPLDPFEDDIFDFFFRRRSPQRRSPQRRYQQTRPVQGSGFIISSDGYILTNNHMVEEAEKVEIELADGRKFSAEIIGADEHSDVAVVKIEADGLPYLELGNSDALEVGEWVLAIGNPLGLSHTVTAGIVSAKGRTGFGLATLENFIQTDAAINFGNSGGPLINLDGQVIAINTAIYGSSGNIGIGFAIPINMAKNVHDQLIESGTVELGFLGVMPNDLDPEMAEAFGLKDTKGVAISEVTEGSAADKAGLKHNDVILEIDGEPVESAGSFRNRIAMLKPGTKLEMVVWRDGRRKTLDVKLGKRPSTGETTGAPPEALDELGFSVRNLTDEFAERYGYEGQSGVIVTDVKPGSQAARLGIVPGVIIKEVNLKAVRNTRQFNEAIAEARKRGKALLLIKRDRVQYFVPLPLSEK
jgi:serine protease Do